MDEIQSLLVEANEFTANQIIDVLVKVGERGDIIIIKNDGLRSLDNYTVVISSGSNKFESIRYDASNLSNAIKKVLKDYVEAVQREYTRCQ
jgi:imidazole glycerol phosphate synthase subunit HisF